MRRHLGILAVLLLVLTLGAGTPKEATFTGLWKGVDRNDGAERTFTIADRDGDGVFEVAIRDTYWTLCEGDRGVHLATGTIQPDGTLVISGLLTCFDIGKELEVTIVLEYDKRTDTLEETAIGTGLFPNTLHRVSG